MISDEHYRALKDCIIFGALSASFDDDGRYTQASEEEAALVATSLTKKQMCSASLETPPMLEEEFNSWVSNFSPPAKMSWEFWTSLLCFTSEPVALVFLVARNLGLFRQALPELLNPTVLKKVMAAWEDSIVTCDVPVSVIFAGLLSVLGNKGAQRVLERLHAPQESINAIVFLIKSGVWRDVAKFGDAEGNEWVYDGNDAWPGPNPDARVLHARLRKGAKDD